MSVPLIRVLQPILIKGSTYLFKPNTFLIKRSKSFKFFSWNLSEYIFEQISDWDSQLPIHQSLIFLVLVAQMYSSGFPF